MITKTGKFGLQHREKIAKNVYCCLLCDVTSFYCYFMKKIHKHIFFFKEFHTSPGPLKLLFMEALLQLIGQGCPE